MQRPEKARSCCFTGYRPEKLAWRFDEEDKRAILLKEKIFTIVEALFKAGLTHFICGMARGADTYFAEAVLLLREEFKEVTLEAAIPFQNQAARWKESEQNRYFRILSQCDFEVVLQESYTADCMRNRNEYMVDNAAVILAVYDGRFGGTMQTVNYAKKSGLELIQITPPT